MKRNLLSENMLRFGTKNLNNKSKRKLVFESVMQTIKEHKLEKYVRRHLSEQGQTHAISSRLSDFTPQELAKMKDLKTNAAAVQNILGMNADGKFGPQTKACVKYWQGTVGLNTDGIVGDDTAFQMMQDSNDNYGGGTLGNGKWMYSEPFSKQEGQMIQQYCASKTPSQAAPVKFKRYS